MTELGEASGADASNETAAGVGQRAVRGLQYLGPAKPMAADGGYGRAETMTGQKLSDIGTIGIGFGVRPGETFEPINQKDFVGPIDPAEAAIITAELG